MHDTHLGQEVASGTPVYIKEGTRANGIYILGKPRMGKSWLMINLAVQDAESGGIFFIDPHGETVDEVLNQICPPMEEQDVIRRFLLIDPTLKDDTVTINPMQCIIDNEQSRSYAFARTKGIFDKLWKNTFEERPWLQLVLQNAIYALIENRMTIVDLPLFFRDSDFRQYIVSNMKYNQAVYEYWTRTFASKDKRDQDNQMEAAQTRCEIMLGHPYIRDVLGASVASLDFRVLARLPFIILIRLPLALPMEVKKILGTILVSEFRHGIETRPLQDRCPYSVFIDEFQNFVNFEDMSTLIVQAPKFDVRTTLAHHDRYGQLGDNKEIAGATAAIVNKVLFQQTGKDAAEFAPEFRDDPPTETRIEDAFVISQSPVWDLMKGHNNPKVMDFVNKYLRPIRDRLSDIYGESEFDRLERQGFIDESGLLRLDSQFAGVDYRQSDYDRMRGSLRAAGRAAQQAKEQTDKLKALSDEGTMIRKTIRDINYFFIEVMEGKVKRGQKEFSDFLIGLVRGFGGIDAEYAEHLINYIVFSYGDTKTACAIPFDVADDAGFFTRDVNIMRSQLEAKLRWENLTKDIIWDGNYLKTLPPPSSYLGKKGANIQSRHKKEFGLEVVEESHRIEVYLPYELFQWSEYALLVDYALMHLYPRIKSMLEPYRASRFSRKDEKPEKYYMRVKITDIEEVIRKIQSADSSWLRASAFSGENIIESFSSFLRRYKEGAFVMLVLLTLARLVYQTTKLGYQNPWGLIYMGSLIDEVDWPDVKRLAINIAQEVIAMEPILSSRVPTVSEIQKLKQLCRQKLNRANEQTQKIVATLDEFVEFCELLTKPENHIRVRINQQVTRQVPTRTTADMINDMTRELTELPKYTAYVKVLQDNGIWKGKITTPLLPHEKIRDEARWEGRKGWITYWSILDEWVKINMRINGFYRTRNSVQEEIKERQMKWRQGTPTTPPSTSKTKTAEKPADKPGKRPPPGGIPT